MLQKIRTETSQDFQMANNKQQSGSLFLWKTLENILSPKMAKNLEAIATLKENPDSRQT